MVFSIIQCLFFAVLGEFALTNTSYYQLLYAFESTSGSISNLYNMINSVASDCSDPTLLGNFIENHDNPRFASYVPLGTCFLSPLT
jgi:hypothetical protein